MSSEILYGMSYEDYDRLDGERHSMLSLFDKSPAHYLHAKTKPRTDTAPFRLGRAVHTATLEPEKFRREYVLWDGKIRRGKLWDAFCRKHADSTILAKAEMEDCLKISTAVRSSAMALPYLQNGRREVTLRWIDEETGIKCKARLDFVSDTGITDLKTCMDASPMKFGRSAANYHYHSQAAFYVDGYKKVTGKELPYVFVPVEKVAPHVAQVYTLGEADLDAGRDAYGRWLFQLKKCHELGRWDGYAEGPIALSLPNWVVGNDDENIEGLDLVING